MLALTITQVLHSVEEYFMRLFDWLARADIGAGKIIASIPAVSMSGDLFLILNIFVVAVFSVQTILVFHGNQWAGKAVKYFAMIEIINGAGHVGIAILMLTYFPGSITGVGLIIIGVILFRISLKVANNRI